jgi:hypothetical protein
MSQRELMVCAWGMAGKPFMACLICRYQCGIDRHSLATKNSSGREIRERNFQELKDD